MASSDSIVIKDSLVYCQRLFAIGSVLPHHQNPKVFKLLVSYFFLLITMQLWDAYDNLHNLQMLLVTAMEWPFMLSMLMLLVLIRTNKKLTMVFEKIQREIKGSILFESDEEKRLYQKYNIISINVGKYVLAFVIGVVYIYYVRPLIGLLTHPRTGNWLCYNQGFGVAVVVEYRFEAGKKRQVGVGVGVMNFFYRLRCSGYNCYCRGAENNTLPFVLPFRVHMLLEYQYNAKMYTLIYIYLFPGTYLSLCHAAEASLIVTSTLHVCARLSVLAYRIRGSLTKSPTRFHQRMRTLVTEHLELTELSSILNDCFKNVLLIEYLNCTFRLGISMYVVLITIGKDTVAFVNFCMYSTIVVAWLYLYAYIGEQLTYESLNVGEAFYDTDWTDIAARDRKSLVICMMNGQQAQYLMAGKFYKFTLFGFSNIVKTSMAFLSVLRTTIE